MLGAGVVAFFESILRDNLWAIRSGLSMKSTCFSVEFTSRIVWPIIIHSHLLKFH
jgi:hypothetical protein